MCVYLVLKVMKYLCLKTRHGVCGIVLSDISVYVLVSFCSGNREIRDWPFKGLYLNLS